jgi:hypothetical protein
MHRRWRAVLTGEFVGDGGDTAVNGDGEVADEKRRSEAVSGVSSSTSNPSPNSGDGRLNWRGRRLTPV